MKQEASQATHTPGPWHVEPEEASDHHGLAICSDHGGVIVATITPPDEVELDDLDHANAQVIAAAPSLLEFAKVIAAMMTEEEFGEEQPEPEDWVITLGDLIASARKLVASAAIAKAKAIGGV